MIHLKVDGMTCEHCTATVAGAVRRVAPGASVTVDLRTGQVVVDGDADQHSVRTAITDAGFDARLDP